MSRPQPSAPGGTSDDRLNRGGDVTRACFNAINQLRALGPPHQAARQRLHARLADLVDRLQDHRDLELSDRDVRDMAYALVALADEIGVGQAEHAGLAGRSGRQTVVLPTGAEGPGDGADGFWRTNLLQMKFFDENVAGEGFFRRLEALRRDDRRVPVLRVYYLCLLFGFQGIYVDRETSELRRLTESVGRELGESLALGATLSPDGPRPDEAGARRRQRRPWLLFGGAALAAALCFYAGLWMSLQEKTEQTDALVQRLKTPALVPATQGLAGMSSEPSEPLESEGH